MQPSQQLVTRVLLLGALSLVACGIAWLATRELTRPDTIRPQVESEDDAAVTDDYDTSSRSELDSDENDHGYDPSDWRRRNYLQRLARSIEAYSDIPKLEYWARVVERDTLRALPGAHVWRQSGTAWPEAYQVSTYSDDNGWVFLRTAANDASAYQVACPGYGVALIALEPGHDAWRQAARIELERNATLTLEAQTATGKAVRGIEFAFSIPAASVARGDVAAQLGVGFEVVQRTRADGRCVFEGMPARARCLWRATSDEEDAGGGLIELEPGENRVVRVTVGGRADVRGVVLTERGEGAPNVELWLVVRTPSESTRTSRGVLGASRGKQVAARATTDATGGFRVADVRAGRWWIGIAPRDGQLAPTALAFDVSPSSSDITLVLHAEPNTQIEGNVVGASGAAAIVRAHGPALAGEVIARVDDDERFVLQPLANGHYELVAERADGKESSEPVLAVAGERDVVLELGSGASIHGSAVDAMSKNVVAANFALWRKASDGAATLIAECDLATHFDFTGLAASAYVIVARTGSGEIGVSRNIELTKSETRTSVPVELAASARIRIRHGAGNALVRYRIRSNGEVIATGDVAAGASCIEFVPAGHLQFEIEHASEVIETRETDVLAGRELELVLDE